MIEQESVSVVTTDAGACRLAINLLTSELIAWIYLCSLKGNLVLKASDS